MAALTLLDLASLNNADPIIGLVESAVWSYPELAILPAVPHPGTSFQVGRRTVLPTAQFAQVGAGVPGSKSTFVLENKEMYLLNSQLIVPLDYLTAQTRAVGDILAIEAKGITDQSFYHITQQLYYGNSGTYGGTAYTPDPNGFLGYCQILGSDSNFVLNAGGASGSSTSLYLVSCHEQGVSLSVGKDGNMQLLPWTQQQITIGPGANDTTTNVTMAMVSAFMGWFGMTAANTYSVWRYKGFDGTTLPTLGNSLSGKSITDGYIAQLLALVPLQYRKNLHIFMNRNGAQQLQTTRSSLGYQPAGESGGPAFPGLPMSSNGIPICITEAITMTET